MEQPDFGNEYKVEGDDFIAFPVRYTIDQQARQEAATSIETFNAKVLRLRQEGATKEEAIEQATADRKRDISGNYFSTVKSYLDKGLSLQQAYAMTDLDIEEAKAEKKKSIWANLNAALQSSISQSVQSTLGSVSQLFGAVSQMQRQDAITRLNTYKETLNQQVRLGALTEEQAKAQLEAREKREMESARRNFKRQQNVALGLAIVNTAAAAVGALADTRGGPAARIAALVAVLAAGAAQIATIKAQRFQGGNTSFSAGGQYAREGFTTRQTGLFASSTGSTGRGDVRMLQEEEEEETPTLQPPPPPDRDWGSDEGGVDGFLPTPEEDNPLDGGPDEGTGPTGGGTGSGGGSDDGLPPTPAPGFTSIGSTSSRLSRLRESSRSRAMSLFKSLGTLPSTPSALSAKSPDVYITLNQNVSASAMTTEVAKGKAEIRRQTTTLYSDS